MILESVGVRADVRGGNRVESYVWNLAVTRHLQRERLELTTPVTIIAGDNGTGKSTFIEALALSLGFPGVGGVLKDPDGLHSGTESPLAWELTPRLRGPLQRGYFLRSETHMAMLGGLNNPNIAAARSVLHRGANLHARSHGESIFDVLSEYVFAEGLYLFDEPESGLTVVRQMALLAEVAQCASGGAQFIIATHSPVLMAIPGARILEATEAGFVERRPEETEAVTAMREFLDDMDGTVRYLTEFPAQ